MPMILTVSERAQHRPKERGAALISMLLISFLLLAAGGALIMTTAMSATNAIDSTAEMQAYYAAQAGLQATLNVFRGNVAPNPLFDTSSATASANYITFRKAVTASTSNVSGDTNSARLSRWLTYNSTYTDRVLISSPYSPLSGMAYSTAISDPDNSAQVTYSTQGAFGSSSAASTTTKNYGNGNSKVTVKFDGQASTTINTSGNSTLGSFTISGLGSQSYTIPANETFKLTIVQTAPFAMTTTISCTLSGTISSTSGQLTITFPTTSPANTNNLQGALYTRTANLFNLPIDSTTPVAVAVTAPEPTRLLAKVIGYGPRAAKKQMQMLLNRFAFDYTPSAAITMRSADSVTSTMTFNIGNSSPSSYTGNDNAGGTNLPGFAVTSGVDYTAAQAQVTVANTNGTNVTGNPAVQQISTSSLSSFLQTADSARALVTQLRTVAQLQNRYYTTALPPSDFGATEPNGLFTFVDGNVDLPPQGGAGLLVVTGTLTMRGSSSFNGVILVLGTGQLIRDGGGGGTSLGSIVVASFASTGNFLAPTFNTSGGGNSTVSFDSEWTRKALLGTGPRVLGVSEY
jgi:hypothetical protein